MKEEEKKGRRKKKKDTLGRGSSIHKEMIDLKGKKALIQKEKWNERKRARAST